MILVTPGITALEYHMRRSKLAAKLPENAIAIFAASDTKYRSGAVFYEFHQEPNFFYLTGFNEPEATAVIQNVGQSGSGEYLFHLFVRQKDPKAELWDGARSGEQAALDVFNADKVRYIQLSLLQILNVIKVRGYLSIIDTAPTVDSKRKRSIYGYRNEVIFFEIF